MVFQKPLKVDLQWEKAETPSSYKKYHPEDVELGDQMNVWYVQRTGKRVCGAVSRPIKASDAPEAEVITLGFAPGKVYESVGVGRHGNFLQWGYGGSASEMTEAGKRLFVNCIVYIHQFDGKRPLL